MYCIFNLPKFRFFIRKHVFLIFINTMSHYKKMVLFRPSFIEGYQKPSRKIHIYMRLMINFWEIYDFYWKIIKTFEKDIHFSKGVEKTFDNIYFLFNLRTINNLWKNYTFMEGLLLHSPTYPSPSQIAPRPLLHTIVEAQSHFRVL